MMANTRFAIDGQTSIARSLLGGFALLVSLLGVALISPAGASAAECTDTWTVSEGNWKTTADWSAGHVPSSSDVACVGSGKSVTITESANHAATLINEGTLWLEGGSLELSSTSEASSIKKLRVSNATLTGASTINVTSELNWNENGIMSGSGKTVVQSGASGELSGGECKLLVLTGRRFVNEGTTTLGNTGSLEMSEGATLENKGTFHPTSESECSGHATIYPGTGAAPKFINTGTVEKKVGFSPNFETKIGVNFENSGTVTSPEYTVTFTAGGSSTGGTWNNAAFAGGTVSFTKDSWSGRIEVTGATVTATEVSGSPVTLYDLGGSVSIPTSNSLTVNTFWLKQATLTGAGTVNVTNSFRWKGGGVMSGSGKTVVQSSASAFLEESKCEKLSENGREFVTEGSSEISAETSLEMSNGAVFENKGTFHPNAEPPECLGPIAIYAGGGAAPKIRNVGTLEKNISFPPNRETKIGVNVENLGTIVATSGTLVLEHPVTVPSTNHFGTHCKCKDPIDASTGDLTETQTDFAIGGRGVGLDLTRTYDAQAAATASSPGIFGYGWTSSFSDHLVVEGTKATVYQADGGTVPFTESGGSFTAPTWSQDTLSGNSETGYTLTLPEQTKYKFSGAGRLESVTDRNENQTTLAYNGLG